MITEEEKDEIIRSQQEVIKDQQKIMDEMKDALREIGDFADGLKSLLAFLLDGQPENTIVNLTLTKITELVDQNI